MSLSIQNAQRSARDKELEYSIESRKLENGLNKLRQMTEELNIQTRSTYRFTKETSLTAKVLPDGAYQVTVLPGLTVASEKSVTMTFIMVDLYRGRLTREEIASALDMRKQLRQALNPTGLARRICPPPGRWSGTCEGSGLEWTRVGTFGSYYPPTVDKLQKMTSVVKREIDAGNIDWYGAGVGPWKTGEAVPFALKVSIKAKPDEYIGASIHLLMNEASSDEDVWWFEKHGIVSELTESSK